MWSPTVVGHLVVVVGLKAQMTRKISKIRKRGANQEPTNF